MIYHAVNEWETISLHDCRIIKIQRDKQNITCYFKDGFWITENNRQNDYEKTLATDDESQIIFINSHCDRVEVNNNEISWETFFQKVNSLEWEFECISEEYSEKGCIYDGWVWFDQEPYHYDARLRFVFDELHYGWNKICENRVW